MKEKIITLTEILMNAGFEIVGIDVEASDIVRIRFTDLNGLELLVNDSFAMIKDGDCSKEKLQQFKKLVEKQYTLKDELESIDNDMFNKLLNAMWKGSIRKKRNDLGSSNFLNWTFSVSAAVTPCTSVFLGAIANLVSYFTPIDNTIWTKNRRLFTFERLISH